MSSLYDAIDRKIEDLRPHLAREDVLADFNQRVDVSWIYHDNALEGVVLSYHELKAAIDPEIISDSTLIPAYDDIKNHKASIELTRQHVARRKPLSLDYLKSIYDLLSRDPQPVQPLNAPPRPARPSGATKIKDAQQYRKDNPLHRLYFHEIAPPEKIAINMRKLGQWLASDEARHMHPVKRAAEAHYRLIAIYPWPKHSGKVARLLMNAMLLRDGYLPAVIHAIERQRYYEVLRQVPSALSLLIAESLSATLDAAQRFFDEIGQQQPAQGEYRAAS